MTTLSHLECSKCGERHEAGKAHNLCVKCQGPLLVRYDLEKARQNWSREWLMRAPASMWRYAPVLPVYTYVSKHLVKPWVQGWHDNPQDVHYSKDLRVLPH